MTLKPLKVMTFNLRYASPTPPNSWTQRHPVVSECLRLMSSAHRKGFIVN